VNRVLLRPRWYKVLADLWGNKVRSALVIASIAVGLFAVGIITTLDATLRRDMRLGYAAVNPANIQMMIPNFGDRLIEGLRGVKGVAEVEGVRSFNLRARNQDGEWVTITMNAIPNPREMKINRLKVLEGVWPPLKRQIVIDRSKLDEIQAGLGEEIELELPSGTRRNLKLVGVVQDQTIGSSGAGGGYFLAPAQGYISMETLEWLEEPQRYNLLYVTVTGDSSNEGYIREVADRVRREVEKSGYVVMGTSVRASDDHPNSSYTGAMSSVLYVLSILVVFLSGFLIFNTFQALLTQQVQQIGIMKIIGGRSRQVIGIYMALIFVFGVLAFLVALPLANRASLALLEFLAYQMNIILLPYRPVLRATLLMLAIALVVPQLAGFVPILQGVRITIQEATSGIRKESVNIGKGWLERRLMRLRGVPRPLVVSLRNTFRRKGRLMLTLLTLSLGGSIFIATFNVRVSVADYISRVGKYFRADMNITFSHPYRVEKVQQDLEALPEIERVEGWWGARGEILDEQGMVVDTAYILAPPAGTPLVSPILLEGRWIEPGDTNAITISERFSDIFPGIKPGDTLKLRINGEEMKWVVVGRFQLVGSSGGYVAYTSGEYLAKQTGMINRTSSFRAVASRQGMTLTEQKALAMQLDRYLKSRGYDVQEITAGLSLEENTTTGLNILTTFLLIMALLTALVGSIGLMGTMSLNVMERTREIGVLRAIGASDGVVIRLVMVEGLLIGWMSWGLSLLLSFPISTLLADAIFVALFRASWRVVFTPLGLLIWLGVVLLLAAVASLLPARNAARLTIREVLAYE